MKLFIAPLVTGFFLATADVFAAAGPVGDFPKPLDSYADASDLGLLETLTGRVAAD